LLKKFQKSGRLSQCPSACAIFHESYFAGSAWHKSLTMPELWRKQKTASTGDFFKSSVFQLHQLSTARPCADFAFVALAADRQHDAAHADNDIDRPLKQRPASEDHVDDIPVAAKEAAEADQAPVHCTDNDKVETDGRHRASLVFHNDTHNKIN